MFGEGSYSYGAITQSIRSLSFTSSQSDKKKLKNDIIHQQRIEAIRKTLENFPFLSLREISRETNIPKTTVYRILRQDLGYVLKHLKWIPHFLNSIQKVSCVDLSQSLLRVLQEASQSNYQLFMTGDES